MSESVRVEDLARGDVMTNVFRHLVVEGVEVEEAGFARRAVVSYRYVADNGIVQRQTWRTSPDATVRVRRDCVEHGRWVLSLRHFASERTEVSL